MPVAKTVFRSLLTGPYSKLEDLIAIKSPAESLYLAPNRKAVNQLAGPYKTRLKGRGMDLEEVRAYQAGDEVRHIDWRVTARTTIPHTKLYTEERERPVLLLCDQRQSMFFGSQVRYKSVQAAAVCATLAWAGLKGKDRVGGLLLGQHHSHEFRPRNTHQGVLTMLASLQQLNSELDRQPSHSPTLDSALSDLRRIAKTGHSIFIVSDFSGLGSEGLQQLYELARHNSVTGFFVYDPLEMNLPDQGLYGVSDGKQRLQVNTGSTSKRQAYEEAGQQRLNKLKKDLGKLGIPLMPVSTADYCLEPLSQLFRHSRRQGRHAQ